MIQRIAIAAALACTTLFSVAHAADHSEPKIVTHVDDNVITSTLKAKLAENKQVSAMSVNVESMNGVVALSGFAKSEEARNTAERLAKGTDGVRSVRNNIIVNRQ